MANGTFSGGIWNGTAISILYGGTNASSQTTNGVNYYNGTSITSDSGLVYSGGKLGVGTDTPQSLIQASGGEVQVGSSGATCSGTNAGAIRYSGGSMSYCNGSAWSPFSSASCTYTWTQRTTSGSRYWSSLALSSDGTHLAATDTGFGSGGYIYTSTDGGATWTQRTGAGSHDWNEIVSSSDGTHLAAIYMDCVNCGGYYIYTSTDGGATWTQRTGSGLHMWSQIASSSDGTRLAATDGNTYNDTSSGLSFNPGYIYTSTNSGVTWTQRTGAGSHSGWAGIASSSDGTQLAAVDGGGGGPYGYIYTSTDGGATWTQRTAAGQRNWHGIYMSSDGTHLGSGADYLYTSSDSGATWTQNLPYSTTYSASGNATRILASGYSSGLIYTSTDFGSTWTIRFPANANVRNVSISADGTYYMTAGYPGYIFTGTCQ